MEPISITAIASVSPLGHDTPTVWDHYRSSRHFFTTHYFGGQTAPAAFLDANSKALVDGLRHSDPKYKNLDESVLYAIAASRQAVAQAGWKQGDVFGVNLGSSRGATGLFEKYYDEFRESGMVPTLTSPTTTSGNIASWVSHDLQSQGPDLSHSITCSTALHALLNGVAWLRSGMADKFLVGGSEAPLTPFTIAQMKAMKIYANDVSDYPCRALDLEKKQNTMILGEAAAVCCLERGEKPNALGYVSGIGYATEVLEHNVSISAEATCFQKSMHMALGGTPLHEVDAIVMHAPGTKAGDLTEWRAVQKVFGQHMPLLTTTKWKTGHTFGASGMLSIELALLMMQHNTFVGVPFVESTEARDIKRVLVNAVGFGGNAVSVLLSKSAQ
ncbi:beta-ketoacyl synthase N-terminal-like domain-containing protein [Flavobacterium caeni]|uniref:beta-ketoacyl synthase N-terminal-like domain-containing protein n=1 Tax=Flavobacterium caeni TaxID=490189 RepID=UPI00373FDACC